MMDKHRLKIDAAKKAINILPKVIHISAKEVYVPTKVKNMERKGLKIFAKFMDIKKCWPAIAYFIGLSSR